MTIELTAERALELLREVVAEYGEDHVYINPDGRRAGESVNDFGDPADCYYVHGDQPGCIAGHVYHRAGLTLEQMRELELSDAECSAFRSLIVGEGPRIVVRAQGTQDNGGTWGEALKAAERAAQAE